MKKLITLLLGMLLVLAGCGSPAEKTPETNAPDDHADSGTITIYTPTAQDNLDVMIPAFEEATGIKVEVIRGSSGEVYSRIQAEAENPKADVAWIPTSTVLLDTSYFEAYTSAYDDQYDETFRNTSGFTTQIGYNAPVIIYNTNLVDFEIHGYADLLNPELKGKIAMGNAASSSSAYNHLENMLLAMGTGTTNDEKAASKEAWDFVRAFYENLDGKIVDSSSVTYEGVLSGEYAVGMTWDTPAQAYMAEGIDNLKVVYMDEGVIPGTSSVSLIKNGPNPEGAKKFIDWFASPEGQSVYGMDCLGANPILPGAKVADYKLGIKDLNVIPRTTEWQAENKEKILDLYEDMYLEIFE